MVDSLAYKCKLCGLMNESYETVRQHVIQGHIVQDIVATNFVEVLVVRGESHKRRGILGQLMHEVVVGLNKATRPNSKESK